MVSDIPVEVVLARLSEHDRRSVTLFRDGLREMLGDRLRDLRLYGSKVRGDDHDESDIDILVLVDSLDTPTRWAITDLAHYTDPMLSPLIDTFDRYHSPRSRATGYYKELRRESVRL